MHVSSSTTALRLSQSTGRKAGYNSGVVKLGICWVQSACRFFFCLFVWAPVSWTMHSQQHSFTNLWFLWRIGVLPPKSLSAWTKGRHWRTAAPMLLQPCPPPPKKKKLRQPRAVGYRHVLCRAWMRLQFGMRGCLNIFGQGRIIAYLATGKSRHVIQYHRPLLLFLNRQ